MPDLTEDHKRALDDALLIVDETLWDGFLPPSPDSPDVRALLTEIGAGEPMPIEHRDDHLAFYRWSADGVQARTAADGGAIRFGWRLLEWPNVLLTAEHIAVWEEPGGALVDITPTPIETPITVFAPSEREPTAAAHYRILHVSPDRTAEIADRVAALKGGQRAYEERRAAKAGQSLTEWIAVKHFTDPLIEAIPAFTAACDAFTAKLTRLPDLIELRPDDWSDAVDGEWQAEWELARALDKIEDWDILRQERLADIEDGLEMLGFTDTRVFADADDPEET